MEAIFCVLRTGCQWKALPATGLCASSSAQRRFQEWAEAGLCRALWPSGLLAYEALQGIAWEGCALEGAMTKAPLGGATVGQNPTDRGKVGTKRRVRTDGGGVPLGLAVEGAKRHDCKRARATRESIPVARPEPSPATPQGMCLDQGDDDDEVRELRAEFGCTAHIRAPGEEAKALKQ
jgi:putative transposase